MRRQRAAVRATAVSEDCGTWRPRFSPLAAGPRPTAPIRMPPAGGLDGIVQANCTDRAQRLAVRGVDRSILD